MKQSSPLMVSHLKNSLNKSAPGGIFLWALLVLGIGALAFFHITSAPTVDTPVASLPIEEPKPITLLFVGDIMMDRGIRSVVNKYFEGDYGALFVNTFYVADADITFANLEGTATSEFGPRTGSKFSFRMAPESLSAIKNAGFDVVSFANNHIGDYSTKGFLETLSNLKENNIFYAGAGGNLLESSTPSIIDIRGTKIGYLAATDVGPDWMKATDTKPGIIIASDPTFSQIIAGAKSQVDVLVVSFHWGEEYSPVSERQEELAHGAIDAGADIVVGHHPHVMQKFEYYNEKVIFYSLGNFIFDQYFSPFTLHGMVGEVSVDPATLLLTASAQISPQNSQYVPQAPFPFEEKFLLVKSFTP